MKIKASSGINSDASNIKNNIDAINKDILTLQQYLQFIPSIWAGQDSNNFINKYKEAISELKKYEKDLLEYHKFLLKVYDLFCTLDEKYGVPINTN